jgi:hypothetical protein
MNYGISILFRLIPILMGILCFSLGVYIFEHSDQGPSFVASHVLISLTAICLALFSTASVIIQQLIKTFNTFFMIVWPLFGYVSASVCILYGLSFLSGLVPAPHFIAGHIVTGVGLIAACVSTVAAASSKFLLIKENSATKKEGQIQENAYSRSVGSIFIAIPIICSLICFIWALFLFKNSSQPDHVIAANVLMGLGAICTSLIALVATVVRQVRNTFKQVERSVWGWLVIIMGSLAVIAGLINLANENASVHIAPGLVLIGLGMICYSISSKVWLLSLVWRNRFSLANRIPLIPIVTCLLCLFASSFFAETAMIDANYFIPSKVLVGLGAVCFTLFSIVSILEAGTSE